MKFLVFHPPDRIARLFPLAKFALKLGLATALVITLAFFLADLFLPLPPAILNPPLRTARLLDCKGNPLAEFSSPSARSHEPLDIISLGPFLPAITVALEDRRFFEHSGIDWRATARSARDNLFHPGRGGGASTITQQYVKLIRGRGRLPVIDKLIESLHARKLERLWSKRRILSAYLNQLDYGNRLIGPAAAARAYFGKDPAALTLAEAVFLAGLPQSPTRLNPWRRPEAANRQFRRSIRRLSALPGPLPNGLSTGLALDPSALADLQPPELKSESASAEPGSDTRFFAFEALQRAGPDLAQIHTTLDTPLQKAVAGLLRAHLKTLNRPSVRAAAAVVLANASAKVRAFFSLDLENPEIDCAQMPRSPGSTLKPFVYLSAINGRKLTAASLLPDTREAVRSVYPDYDPRNYSDKFLGPVRLREALACSLNVPAVLALERVGARAMFHQFENWGIRFHRPFDAVGAGFLLGNCEVTLLDLAAGYSAIARGGLATPPRFLEQESAPHRPVASPEACALLADILSDNNARTREFGLSSPLATPVRVAAKTGTSSGFRDAWVVGFTRDHTVAVWIGNSSGRTMGELPAIRGAAPLWRAIIDLLLANGDRPLLNLDDPSHPLAAKLESTKICALTGLLASERSPATIKEFFLPGTVPAENSAGAIEISDNRAIPLLDPEYAAWCASPDNYLGARIRPDETPKILFPTDGDILALDREISPAQQHIELRASLPPGRRQRWLINGKEIEPHAGRYFWQLVPGRHEATLLIESGNASRPPTALQSHFKVLPAR